MFKRVRLLFGLLVLMLATTGMAAAAPRVFIAEADGTQEVPAVETSAQGAAVFVLSDDGESLGYRVWVIGLEDVRFAHIHLAPEGANGPVVAFLRRDRVDGPVRGKYAEGILTAADLVGPLAGKSVSDLVAEIKAGNTYINIHTDAFPPGELRGQIRVR
ncbi:MAG: CHRD domain-containing protein [Chloroflexales bacterium]|nr:CHRD domain-containing protein [Chloroflexales bacterium]